MNVLVSYFWSIHLRYRSTAIENFRQTLTYKDGPRVERFKWHNDMT